MGRNNSGRTAALFLAVLGAAAAFGLSAFWFSGSDDPPDAEDDAVAKTEETPKAEALVTQTAQAPPKKKKKLVWEGGGQESSPRGSGTVYAGPARRSFGSGAVNQPPPTPRFPQFKTTREQLPNGKTRITLYQTR